MKNQDTDKTKEIIEEILETHINKMNLESYLDTEQEKPTLKSKREYEIWHLQMSLALYADAVGINLEEMFEEIKCEKENLPKIKPIENYDLTKAYKM